MLRSLPNTGKSLFQQLPANDCPVLHSQLFPQIWLTFILYFGQEVNQYARPVLSPQP